MALAALWLGWPGIGKSEFTVGLALLGLGGGLFIVPIVSVLQHRPSAQTKGAVQGAASWLSWVGIAAAAMTQTFLSGPASSATARSSGPAAWWRLWPAPSSLGRDREPCQKCSPAGRIVERL